MSERRTGYKIRRAGLVDGEAVMGLLLAFGEEYRAPYAPSDEGLKGILEQVLYKGECFVADSDGEIVGGIGGAYYRNTFNPGVMVLGELFWYVCPDWRGTQVGGRLFLEYEKAGYEKSHGMTMTLLDSSDPRLDNSLKKRGFVVKERNYIKWRR